MITLLTAWDDNKLIGKGSGLPWHLPEDLKLFKERTKGQSVIMGLKTYNGLPIKPLPNRTNIVLMRKEEYKESFRFDFQAGNGTYLVAAINGVKEAIDISKRTFPNNEIYICGGASIYKQALEQDLVDRMLVSVVPGEHDGDVYFPDFPGMWNRHIIEYYDNFNVEEWPKDQK